MRACKGQIAACIVPALVTNSAFLSGIKSDQQLSSSFLIENYSVQLIEDFHTIQKSAGPFYFPQ